jgi:hypothetical protein
VWDYNVTEKNTSLADCLKLVVEALLLLVQV